MATIRKPRAGVIARCLAPALVLAVLSGSPATAAQPAALVEDVSGKLAGVAVMDYLDRGRTVDLAPGQVLTLSYLASCTYERITGGTVTVGMRESAVAGGSVERRQMPCDGGSLLLAAGEADKAGVSVFRDGAIALAGSLPRAQVTLFRTKPVLVLGKPGRVVFERLDSPDQPLEVEVPARTRDLAKDGPALKPGGLYRVRNGDRSLVVKVDPGAGASGGPALGRLIRF